MTRMSHTKYITVMFLAILAAAFVLPACGEKHAEKAKEPPPDVFFEGVLVERYGNEVVKMEAHITRPAQRLVPIGAGNAGAVIVRRDLGVVWNLMPENKVFLETPLGPKQKNPLIYEPDKILEREDLGEDYVEGLKTEKERIVFQNDGDTKKTMIRWMADGIDWPLKAEDPDGKWEMHYENIVFRQQKPEYFTIPEGYSKINSRMPKMHSGS